MKENGLIRKKKKDILTNISRSKGNQSMKFGQLIEYNTRNIFLDKSYTKYGGETIPGETISGSIV